MTDITIVEESPRKSPRQNAARFYSASQRASSASKTSSKSVSTAGECSSEDKTVLDNKSTRALHRTQSLNIDTVSSPRSKYTKLLNISKSSFRKPNEGDSFADVFLETRDQNETNILSACTSGTQENITSCPDEVPGNHGNPNFSPRSSTSRVRKRNISSEHPSKVSTESPPTPSTVPSVSQRSNLSPSSSITPPPKPSKSPLISRKSFPTTSPVLFKTPTTTTKSSPINFSPDQIFDIAIPLTPVKSPLVKQKKPDLPRNSNLKTTLEKSEVSKNVGAQSERIGFTSNLKRPLGKSRVITSPSENIDTPSILFVADSSSVQIQSERVGSKRENAPHDLKGPINDLENIVAASPLANRKRSLTSSTKSVRSKTLNFGKRNFSRCSEVDCAASSSDVANEETAEVERPDADLEKEVLDSPTAVIRDQNEVFRSPVATKRKGSTRTENVSPLNQILKQRKNNRNTLTGKKYWADHGRK